MNDAEIRRAILQTLYDLLLDRGKTAGVSTQKLADTLKTEPEVVERQIRALKELGFVGRLGQINYRITADGISELEGRSGLNQSATHVHNSIEIIDSSVGQLNQGHTINNPSLFLSQLAEAIEKQPDLDPEKKASWKNTLLEISKHPLLPVLLEAARKIVPG